MLTMIRIVATNSRNLVLAILARLATQHEQVWPDGLAPFGVRTLAGLEPKIHLPGRDWPYSQHGALAGNDNTRPVYTDRRM